MLQKVDNVTVSQAVISTLSWYGICFDSISVFDTDNAAYCLKAVQTLKQLCPNAVHITCLAHIMNLIGQAFKSPFQLITSFVVYFSRIFYNAGARKGRYLSYLRAELEKNLDVLTQSTAETSKARQKPIVTMPPSPIATRWNSWFLCVSYHNKYFKYYKKFFEAEMQLTNTPPESVKELHNMLQSISKWQELKACLTFLSQKATTVLSYIDIFQTRRPLTVKTFDHLEDLQIFFATN